MNQQYIEYIEDTEVRPSAKQGLKEPEITGMRDDDLE